MTLAVLGTGIMGAAMARNWLATGERVRVWNRTHAKAAPLADAGAAVADSPAAAVDGADVVVTMLFDADSILEALTAAADKLRPGALWLQMSTVGVEGSARLADFARARGLTYVDAPVMGTRQPAEQGQLGVLASGPEQVREQVERLLAPVAARVAWLGPAGAGSRMKLVVNAWVVAALAGVAQALALADALDLEPREFLGLIEGGPMDLGYAHVKGELMLRGEYPTSFAVSGARKDATLIVEAARASGVDLAGVDEVRRLLDTVAKRGRADEDFAAVYEAIRHPS
jgi:3-hydroxyisobutyrate dehydrogenase